MKCPKCDGKGGSSAITCPGGQIRYLPCPMCKETGEIPDSMEAQIEAGRKLRESRNAEGLSLREKARQMQISPVELSHMEQGRIPIEDWSIVTKVLKEKP